MYRWVQTALRKEVTRRSLRVAMMVGTVLILVNYHDRLLALQVTMSDCTKFALTYCVPYFVTTWASVSAILGKDDQGQAGQS